MEGVRDKFPSLGSRETSVAASADTTLETDYFLPSAAGAGKSVLWCVNFFIFSFWKLTASASSTIIEEIKTMQKSGLASLDVLL